MDENLELRRLGIFGTAALWGTAGVICLLNIAKGIFTATAVQPLVFVGLIATIVTVFGVLHGDKRRAVGVLWLVIAVLGFLMFVVGTGFEVEWLVNNSVNILLCGLISVLIIFLPDRSP